MLASFKLNTAVTNFQDPGSKVFFFYFCKLQKIIFNFLEKKDQIFRKIRENFGNVEIIQKIIQNYSVVSLDPGRDRGARAAPRPRNRAPRARAGAQPAAQLTS